VIVIVVPVLLVHRLYLQKFGKQVNAVEFEKIGTEIISDNMPDDFGFSVSVENNFN
jgi:hypothetical protein